MTHVLRIDQAGRLPLFVRCLRRDGSVTVTFELGRARRFQRDDQASFEQARVAAENWREPGQVSFSAVGV